jgi:RNA polymerase sigma-70 factor (ECF subfamily)
MVTNFHELYQEHAQDVYRFAYWLCGDAQDAEDITSETFVRALTATGEIKVETVKGYLLTIAKNVAFKRSKQAKRFTFLGPNLRAALDGPEKAVETNLNLQSAMRFMQTLPAIDRAALLMHVQDGLTYEEIATALGISLSAAKVKIHRARMKLAAYRIQQEELSS